MTYEKALELKNAGFPQKHQNEFYATDCNCGLAAKYRTRVEPDEPTLEELIKACGNGKGFTISRDIYGIWRTEIEKETETEWGIVYSCGETVTESVANLWIALNKK